MLPPLLPLPPPFPFASLRLSEIALSVTVRCRRHRSSAAAAVAGRVTRDRAAVIVADEVPDTASTADRCVADIVLAVNVRSRGRRSRRHYPLRCDRGFHRSHGRETSGRDVDFDLIVVVPSSRRKIRESAGHRWSAGSSRTADRHRVNTTIRPVSEGSSPWPPASQRRSDVHSSSPMLPSASPSASRRLTSRGHPINWDLFVVKLVTTNGDGKVHRVRRSGRRYRPRRRRSSEGSASLVVGFAAASRIDRRAARRRRVRRVGPPLNASGLSTVPCRSTRAGCVVVANESSCRSPGHRRRRESVHRLNRDPDQATLDCSLNHRR